jgi:hypothetical protein
MPSSKFLRSAILVFGMALTIVACSNSSDETPSSALQSSDGILKYVPSDTPYVFATPEAMPNDVLDKLEPHIDAILSSYKEIAGMALDNIDSTDAEDAEDAANINHFVSVAEEFMGLMGHEELRAAGIPRNARTAIYGVGMLPVLRVQLDDAGAFEKTVARFEGKAGKSMQTDTVNGQDYRYAGDDGVRFILGVIDSHVVVTVVPTALSDEQLAAVLGITLPSENIGASGGLEKIAKEYGYAAYALGYFDFERMVSVFLDNQDGVNAELLSLLDYEDELTDVCRAEIREMSGIMPRIVSGYTAINVKKFSSNTIIELRPDIATGLAGIIGAVPGLGVDHGGLMSFGMSINLLGAREFYAARLDALEADPYQCELFAEFQDGVVAGRQALQQPVPPIAYDFNGFLAVVDDIEGFDLTQQKPPTDIDMGLLIATQNAEGLLAMGAMFSPELAALNLEPNGKPVKFDVPQVAAQIGTAFLGMNENGLGIAVGDNAESRLTGMLAASAGDPPPFFSVNMDAARYYNLVAEGMMVENPDQQENVDPSGMPPEFKNKIGDVVKELGKIMNRISVDFYFTEKGMEIPTTVTLVE